MARYIVFEGNDGSGKTQLSKSYAKYINAIWTYEPYGGEDLEACRIMRRSCLHDDIEPIAREFMLLAGRSISLSKIVKPALANGKNVVSDRSFISGMVYAAKEFMPFKEWYNLAFGLNIISVLPEIVIHLVSERNTNNRPDKLAGDRYDGMSAKEYDEINNLFIKAFDFMCGQNTFESIKIIPFQVDFSLSEEQNLQRLVWVLEND